MQRPRVHHSPGWAAFDRKQRARDSAGGANDVDPFPSISSSNPAKAFVASNSGTVKSFSSVVRPSIEFPLLASDSESTNSIDNPAVRLLKDVHSWADHNLIEDILTAVSNDIDQASVLLKAMVSVDSEKLGDNSLSGQSSSNHVKDKHSKGATLVETNPSDSEYKLSASMRVLSIPREPEWEESEDDDVYLSLRKDAIKMMRAASQHSRAASNAFLRGDHLSAREFSQKAREEWAAAEKLNSKVAVEILQLRNRNNDLWKIDLHGLHASEAVKSLKDRLDEIECRIIMDRAASSDALSKLEARIVRSPSLESLKHSESEIAAKKAALLPQRQSVLHVITGTGNHSRGEASLPAAVKSFLIENGYRFDDARSGVIAVRPKFRHK
uniref:Smr domain-containing protein n=1 Tax=Ananas comosus var. bracteatus TaxID=296719 RepID=A0A6V7Q1R3_ANACO|nr:unnamed protein product [Ananas comosus var. bracteatus]